MAGDDVERVLPAELDGMVGVGRDQVDRLLLQFRVAHAFGQTRVGEVRAELVEVAEFALAWTAPTTAWNAAS